MTAALGSHSDLLVRETLSFGCQTLGVSAALFYWVDRRQERMQVLDTVGVPTGFLEHYSRDMQDFDPMSVSQMLARHESVGVLSITAQHASQRQLRYYYDYLNAYDIVDTVDLMFWGQDTAFGGVGFLKTRNDPTPTLSVEGLAALQRFLQASFSTHPHVRQLQLEQHLAACGLSHRERQVVKLIGAGASNREVAQAMNITLATAKTYVVRIFEKLNLDSRTALAAYVAKLN